MEILPDAIRCQLPFRFAESMGAIQVRRVSSGLSGSAIYRVDRDSTGGIPWCVRAWPTDVAYDRINDLQTLVSALVRAGMEFIAGPVRWRDQSYVQESCGRYWDLAEWLPGSAVLSASAPPELWEQAGIALGRVHAAWRQFAVTSVATIHAMQSIGQDVLRDDSHTCWTRIRFAEHFLQDGLDQIQESVRRSDSDLGSLVTATVTCARKTLPTFVESLRVCAARKLRLQIVLRDVRPEHILFDAGKLTGIVDYDAIRWDSVSCDLARVMEPLSGPAADGWRALLRGYAHHSELDSFEIELLKTLHAANPILALLQWLTWNLVERREFASGADAIARMAQLAALIAIKP